MATKDPKKGKIFANGKQSQVENVPRRHGEAGPELPFSDL